MEDIASFKIDHDVMSPGFYYLGEANGVYTYDLRFKTPNGGDYIPTPVLHSIEHMFATVVRNSELKDKVVYFGPMGCRTGFYLLLYGIAKDEALALTKRCLEGCLALSSVPGIEKKQCGNYLEHDYDGSIKELSAYQAILAQM